MRHEETTRRNGRSGRFHNHFLLLISVLALLFIVNNVVSSVSAVAAQTVVAEEEDFLAEILAEQAREEEELARLEAEVKEYEALQHARKEQQQQQHHYPGGSGSGGPGSKMKMGKGKTSSFATKLEEELANKMEAGAAAKAATEEEEATNKHNSKQDDEEAERIRLQRETAYEIQLQQMNTEQRNKAKKQKLIDAKIVSRIIKYYKSQKYYSVLGITNMEIQLGPYYIFNGRLTIGPYRLLHIPTKEIKRIYRNIAKLVHPDKNCDGRAVEAFHALEESAAIVTNDKLRSEYDKRLVALRRHRNEQIRRSIVHICAIVWKKSRVSYQLVKHILGPFVTPILVITALII